ncbi:MAG: GAF domain-containing protein [Bacteroidales bacterium]|nr:GAF domain-containing protein [Bacteroidales bacterium]
MKKIPAKSDQEISASIRQLSLILKITRAIICTLDYEKVLQIISNGMSELLGIESAAIYLLEGNDQLYLGATTPPLDPGMPDSLRRAPLSDHPHIHQSVITKQPQLIADTANEQLSPAEKNVIEMRYLRSLLFFPFVQEDAVLGVLIVGTCNKSRGFSPSEIDLGQTVANQLSIAIQNTRLHADLKNHKENLELLVQEKTKDLDAAIEELRAANEELFSKNESILQQNEELETAMQHLKDTQTQLVQAEKMASLGILTAGVAHEINNPLNFIMGAYVGLEDYFRMHGNNDEKTIPILLKALKTGVDNASRIIQGLNQFSRESKTYREDCDIHAILDNCLLMMNNQLKGRVKIRKEYHPAPLIIKGNVGKMHQVVLNILGNASQAIESKGEISVQTFAYDNQVIIDIKDTGCGIAKENLSKVTDPFFTTKPPGKGTGLGLSITYSIVKEHKGKLEFESVPGQGTSVKVILPNK